MPRRRKKAPSVFVVSDGRGETATQVLKAAVVQFEGASYHLVVRGGIRSPEDVAAVVEEAAESRALILYTLVAQETRRAMRRESGRRLVPTVDLLGPVFSALHDLLELERAGTPGLLYSLDRERIDRMAAIDYTLRHDDGQRPHELSKADVVLVGVSRSSKSATCFYLAYEGIRAANVPLVPGVDPPPQLLKLPRTKVVGLRVNVDRLMYVRETRAEQLGWRGFDDYVDKRTIAREVLAANRLMDRHGWRSLDASYMAIEEIAKEVLRIAGLHGGPAW